MHPFMAEVIRLNGINRNFMKVQAPQIDSTQQATKKNGSNLMTTQVVLLKAMLHQYEDCTHIKVRDAMQNPKPGRDVRHPRPLNLNND